MRVYAMRNNEGYYISMNGNKTKNWFEASKFGEDNLESRIKYTNPEFKLVAFELTEITDCSK